MTACALRKERDAWRDLARAFARFINADGPGNVKRKRIALAAIDKARQRLLQLDAL